MPFYLNEDVIARVHHNEKIMILNRATEKFIFLDSVGGSILKGLLAGFSLAHVIEQCENEFESIGDIHQDVYNFVQNLIASGWLIEASEIRSNSFIRGESLIKPIDLVYLELTNRCNLGCQHCYMNAENHPKDPPAMNWIDFIREMDELGVLKFVVTGGEPTLHPEFENIISEIKKRKIKFALFTNGTTLNTARVDFLKEASPEFVAISLDGADSVTHNTFRRAPAFDKTIKGIKDLVSKNVKVRVNMTLNKYNEYQLEDMIRLASSLGVYEIRVESYSECGRGEEYFTERLGYTIGKVVDTRVNEVISKLKAEGENVPKYGYQSVEDYSAFEEIESNIIYPVCGVGNSIFLVKGNGNVTLCTLLNDQRFTAGNVISTPVIDIWNHSSRFDELRNHELNDTNCSGCHAVRTCQGGCKARAFFAYGSFRAPDPWNCSINDGVGRDYC